MDRRKAITTAAAASLTLVAGAAGLAFNSGLVDATDASEIGHLSPASTTGKPPATVHIEDVATATAASPPTLQPSASTPVATSSASAVVGDSEIEGDDELEQADEHEQEVDDPDHAETESHEYEGAEDDD
jgi:hypothetical protein